MSDGKTIECGCVLVSRDANNNTVYSTEKCAIHAAVNNVTVVGDNNVVSGSNSMIVGGGGNRLSGERSVMIACDRLTVDESSAYYVLGEKVTKEVARAALTTWAAARSADQRQRVNRGWEKVHAY